MRQLQEAVRGKSMLTIAAIGLSMLSSSCHSPAAAVEPSLISIYQDEFATGVSNWSWTSTNPSADEQVDEGAYALYGELNEWEGVYLRMQPAIEVSQDARLEFSIYSENDTQIAIQTSSDAVGDGTRVLISVAANQWQRESISVAALGIQDAISGIWWQQFLAQSSGGVYLDNIRISAPAAVTAPDTGIDDPDDTSTFATVESTSRFLSRATFGATDSDINRLRGSSASDWFRQELNKPASSYLDATLAELQQAGATDPSGEPTFQGRSTPNFVFWRHAISAQDQLRQRMMYALSQILVISNSQSNLLFDRPTSVAAFQDILSRHALGNYRDLLQDVTYSPAMGEYLTYMQNRKGDDDTGRMPDENYARELMQLFTIGLLELDDSGQPRLQNGEPVETYTNRDVSGLARVFTGMSYALDAFEPGFVPISSDALSSPMVFFPERHEAGEKRFLDIIIPAGTSGEESIAMALDALMDHPNTPPFITRQLIQRFVSSHPAPAYIKRVADAFAQGRFTLPDGGVVGTGRRGDLAATSAAILFDVEAQLAPGADTQSGKLREPVLRFTHWARAFNADALTVRHAAELWDTGGVDALAQSPFRSASVFNFYRPGYIAPGTETGAAGLTMPELQLVSASSVPGFVNFMRGFVFADGQGSSDADRASSFIPDYSEEAMLADQPEELIARLNRVLAAGRLRPETSQRIADFLDTVPLSDPQQEGYDGRELRVMHAVLMVMSASEYTVQF